MNAGEFRGFGKNIILTIGRQLATMIVALTISIFIARYLGREGNGVYSIVILLPTVLANILSFGIAPSNVYHVASKQISLSSSFFNSLLIFLLSTVLGGGIGYYLVKFQGDALFPNIDRGLLYLSLLYFPILSFNNIFNCFFQAIQNFKLFNLSLLIPNLFTLLFTSTVMLLGYGLQEVIIAHISAQFLGSLLIFFLLWKEIKIQALSISLAVIKKTLSYGFKSHLSNILTLINYRADLYLVNLFINPAAVGIYTVGVQLVERLWMLSQVTSSVVLPKLSEKSLDNQEMIKITPFIVRWIGMITILGALTILAASPIAIPLLYGKEFSGAVSIIYYLMPGIVATAIGRILSNDIAARGKPELNFYTAIFTVTLNLSLNFLLIESLGIIGCAIATSSAYIMNLIIKIVIYLKVSNTKLIGLIKYNELDNFILKKIKAKKRSLAKDISA